MKCPKCQIENKEAAKACRKCGAELQPQVPLWRPGWRWHATALTIIYTGLIVLFFLLNHLLRPYLRQIPEDITPWLKEVPKQESVG